MIDRRSAIVIESSSIYIDSLKSIENKISNSYNFNRL